MQTKSPSYLLVSRPNNLNKPESSLSPLIRIINRKSIQLATLEILQNDHYSKASLKFLGKEKKR